MPKSKRTTDALKILDKWFFEGKPEMQALLDDERKNAAIAREIVRLREAAGLSQRELARRPNTTASVLCQLEDADYEGHSLSMLRRIAIRLNIFFRPKKHFARKFRYLNRRLSTNVRPPTGPQTNGAPVFHKGTTSKKPTALT